MAIANYTDLKSAISDWLARGDLDARIPDFITMAEARLSRVLRTRDMETAASGSWSASGSFTLPTNYLEWISLQWNGSSRFRDLQYAEPDSEQWRYRYRPNGDPQMFTVLAGSIFERPYGAGNYALVYYRTIPALADSPNNWLLTRSPDLYLYSSLAEAATYMKDDQRAQEYASLANVEAGKMTLDADSNKVARRPYRQAEAGEMAQSRSKEAGVMG